MPLVNRKAAEDCRTPRRWRVFRRPGMRDSVLECASPLALCRYQSPSPLLTSKSSTTEMRSHLKR
jgi:hypothetical protein